MWRLPAGMQPGHYDRMHRGPAGSFHNSHGCHERIDPGEQRPDLAAHCLVVCRGLLDPLHGVCQMRHRTLERLPGEPHILATPLLDFGELALEPRDPVRLVACVLVTQDRTALSRVGLARSADT